MWYFDVVSCPLKTSYTAQTLLNFNFKASRLPNFSNIFHNSYKSYLIACVCFRVCVCLCACLSVRIPVIVSHRPSSVLTFWPVSLASDQV